MFGIESVIGILWIYNILFFVVLSVDFINFRNVVFEVMVWVVV